MLWGSIQELELAQPEVPGGERSVWELHRTLKVSNVLNPFFTKPSSPLSDVVVGFEGFFPPHLSFSFVCSLCTAVFQSSSITAAHCLQMSHSLISQMVRNALVGSCVYIKERGQEEGVSSPWAKKPSTLTETVDTLGRNMLWHYLSYTSQKTLFFL